MIDLFYASSNDSKIQNLKNWLAEMPIHIFIPKDQTGIKYMDNVDNDR